jgi:hypothetical protein
MKTIYALSGPSGSGKTFRRLNDPELKKLPCFDIADVYKKWPDIGWETAYSNFFNQIQDALEDHDAVVIEAYMRKGTPSRNYFEQIFHECEIRYIICWADLETCKQRVKDQGLWNTQKRIELLEKTHALFPHGDRVTA